MLVDGVVSRVGLVTDDSNKSTGQNNVLRRSGIIANKCETT